MRAVLFDMDGTLTDTLSLVVHGLNAALAPHWGHEKDLGGMRALFGPSEERLIAREAPADPGAVERFYRAYMREHQRLARLFPEVTEALEGLRAHGVRLGLVTNKGRRSTEITLDAFGLRGYFDAIVTGDDLPVPKPDPSGIAQVLGELGASPDEAAYVGDSPGDMRAARAAGVLAVGAGWQAAEVPGAQVVLRSPRRLLALIDARSQTSD